MSFRDILIGQKNAPQRSGVETTALVTTGGDVPSRVTHLEEEDRFKTIDGKEVVEEELLRGSKMCECKLSVCVRRERAD